TFRLIELDATRLKLQTAEIQHAPHISFEVFNDVFVGYPEDPAGKRGVPVLHQLEIGPVVAGDVLDTIGKLLSTRKQLLQIAEAAGHGLASRVNDPGVRQHEMDQPNVSKVVGHFVDEERSIPAISACVADVSLAEFAEIFRAKFGKNTWIVRIAHA